MGATETLEAKTPRPSLRQLLSWLRLPMWDKLRTLPEFHESLGPVFVIKLGPEKLFFVNDPAVIEECLVTRHKDFWKGKAYWALGLVTGNGLVNSEEDFHHRQRRMIQPAFHKKRITEYAKVMGGYALEMCDEWSDGETRDIKAEMIGVTLNIVGRALFNSDVRSDTGDVGEAVDTLMNMDRVFVNPLGPLVAKLPLPINKRRIAETARLDNVVYKMIGEHRKSGDQGDLLSMLLQAQDEDDGTRMTEKQVRDEAVTLFLAGHETTANALTWTWYLLAQNPEAEAKMHEEIDRVLGDKLPTAEDYPALDYTRRVLAESMRMYPPVFAIQRTAARDTQLGGHRIPAGSQVVVSQYVTQRNPTYFPNPDRFDPDRFLPEAQKDRPKFAYFPFGGGKRLCVGEGFAWMEGVLVLATVARRYKLRLVEGHEVTPEPQITLRPRGGLPMVIEQR